MQVTLTDYMLAETANLAFSGSLVPEGQGEGIVVRTGNNTVIGTLSLSQPDVM